MLCYTSTAAASTAAATYCKTEAASTARWQSFSRCRTKFSSIWSCSVGQDCNEDDSEQRGRDREVTKLLAAMLLCKELDRH